MGVTSKKIIAVLLLLLFLEKSGVRLFIHNHYHQYTIKSPALKGNKTITGQLSAQCDCLDDFFNPLTTADETFFPSPGVSYNIEVTSVLESLTATTPRFSFWLRGPPALG